MADDEIRINARLSGEDARRFAELQALDGSATNVIREAVREYHVKRIKSRRNAYEMMVASGFIGCADGPEDLSVRYKEYLTESLSLKHSLAPEVSTMTSTPAEAVASARPRKRRQP